MLLCPGKTFQGVKVFVLAKVGEIRKSERGCNSCL